MVITTQLSREKRWGKIFPFCHLHLQAKFLRKILHHYKNGPVFSRWPADSVQFDLFTRPGGGDPTVLSKRKQSGPNHWVLDLFKLGVTPKSEKGVNASSFSLFWDTQTVTLGVLGFGNSGNACAISWLPKRTIRPRSHLEFSNAFFSGQFFH